MKEILFGGKPRIPSRLEFEDAEKGNPAWMQALSKEHQQFLEEDPSRKQVYGDPEKGANLQQSWMTCTLFGLFPYCLLSTNQEPVSTGTIKTVLPFTSQELVQILRKYLKSGDAKSLQTLYFDGTIGHCINLLDYNEPFDRFLYSDTWPLKSLLAAENNEAGIDAQHVAGQRWSITGAELEKVIFACFMAPSEWLRLHGQPVFWQYPDWQKAGFHQFFHLSEVAHTQAEHEMTGQPYHKIMLKTGGFPGMNAIELHTTPEGEIRSGTLTTRRDWIASHFVFAIDIFKSFLGSLWPLPEQPLYEQLVQEIWQYKNLNVLQSKLAQNPTLDDATLLMLVFLGEIESHHIGSEFSQIDAKNVVHDNTALFQLHVVMM
jgi:hypothetical protein